MSARARRREQDLNRSVSVEFLGKIDLDLNKKRRAHVDRYGCQDMQDFEAFTDWLFWWRERVGFRFREPPCQLSGTVGGMSNLEQIFLCSMKL